MEAADRCIKNNVHNSRRVPPTRTNIDRVHCVHPAPHEHHHRDVDQSDTPVNLVSLSPATSSIDYSQNMNVLWWLRFGGCDMMRQRSQSKNGRDIAKYMCHHSDQLKHSLSSYDLQQ